jgi:hypothetical protein
MQEDGKERAGFKLGLFFDELITRPRSHAESVKSNKPK